MTSSSLSPPAKPASGQTSKKAVPVGKVMGIVFLGVVLYAAFALTRGFDTLKQTISGFQWWSFGAACLLAFGNYLLRFGKWEFYLRVLGVRGVSKADSFLTFLSGFVLTVTPGKVGEVFKSVVLQETHGVPVERTAPIVVAERVTDLIGIVVLILVGSVGFRGGWEFALAGAVLIVVGLFVISSRKLAMKFIRYTERLPGKLGTLGSRLEVAYESLSTLVRLRNLLLPTALSIVAWLLECFALSVILVGLSEPPHVALCIFFYATSTLAGALIPVPGGLGVTEGALQSQMTTLGHIPAGASTAAMILVRFATLWFAVLVGFVALFALKRKRPGLLTGAPSGAGSLSPAETS